MQKPELEEKISAHIINLNPLIGAKTLIKLHNYFGSFQNAYENLKKGKIGIWEKEPRWKEIFRKTNIINIDKEIQNLEKAEIEIILFKDQNYPKLLGEIHDKPALLYCRGKTEHLDAPGIAVVGTRKFSSYGRLTTETLVEKIVESGLAVTSGLAMGIDAWAHTITLKNQGLTFAVCPGGIDNNSIYPKINYFLAQKILKSDGLLISENPPGSPTLKHLFPVRNRIIAGLTLGTLIIEAGEKSGALHTARAALEYNREVFAVPGDITKPGSAGPNNLIRMGAKLVTSTNDILEELNLGNLPIKTRERPKLSPEEEKLLDLLSQDSLHIDKIVSQSKLNTSLVNSTLTLLEIKGLIKNLGNNYYIKTINVANK